MLPTRVAMVGRTRAPVKTRVQLMPSETGISVTAPDSFILATEMVNIIQRGNLWPLKPENKDNISMGVVGIRPSLDATRVRSGL